MVTATVLPVNAAPAAERDVSAKIPPVRRLDDRHAAPPPPRLPTVPNASATSYWTAGDLCRLFGVPPVLLDALVPVGVAAAPKWEAPETAPVGSRLYDPTPVAKAMQEFAALRAERRKADREERPLPPAPVGSHRHRREVRNALFAADRRCRYCGRGIRRRSDATIDHMIPVVRGGSDAADNLTLCCQRCNVSKGDQTPQEWAAQILAAQPAVTPAAVEPPRPTAASASPDRFEALRKAQDALCDVEVRISNLYGDAITANGLLDSALRELLGPEAVAESASSEPGEVEEDRVSPKPAAAPTPQEPVDVEGLCCPIASPEVVAAMERLGLPRREPVAFLYREARSTTDLAAKPR